MRGPDGKQTPEDRYRETMQRDPPPPVSPDEPLAWQWDYRGTKQERDELLNRMLEPDERGPQPEQDEALF